MRKKIWSKNDLIIALFIAKFSIRGLGKLKPEIAKDIIQDTTVKSLNMQAANFRYLLNLDGVKLSGSSALKIEVRSEFGFLPYSKLRPLVLKIFNEAQYRGQLEMNFN